MYLPHLKIHSSVSGHLHYFYFLAIVSHAAVNLAGQMLFLGDPAFNSFGHEEIQTFLSTTKLSSFLTCI